MPSFISDSNTSSGVITEEEAIRQCVGPLMWMSFTTSRVTEAKTRKKFDLRLYRSIQTNVGFRNVIIGSSC